MKVLEYPDLPTYSSNKVVGVALAVINGIYPGENKWARNREVDMWYLATSGKGVVELKNGKRTEIAEGEVVEIPKGEWYRVQGENLKIWIITIPPWYSGQYEIFPG